MGFSRFLSLFPDDPGFALAMKIENTVNKRHLKLHPFRLSVKFLRYSGTKRDQLAPMLI